MHRKDGNVPTTWKSGEIFTRRMCCRTTGQVIGRYVLEYVAGSDGIVSPPLLANIFVGINE